MRTTNFGFVLSAVLAAALGAAAGAAGSGKPAAEDAVKIEVGVAPVAVAAGSEAEVTVKLSVNPGYKLNKYPRIKLAVPAVEGLVAAAEASMGANAPPSPEDLEKNRNYFTSVDPLRIKLAVNPSASSGRHDLDARLSYFYCVAASGYCAPAKVPLKIPLTVR
jgi:hypothetical protein